MAFRGKRGLIPNHSSWPPEDSSDDESSESDDEPVRQQPVSAPPPKFGGKGFHGKGAAFGLRGYKNPNLVSDNDSSDNNSDSEYDHDQESGDNSMGKKHTTAVKKIHRSKSPISALDMDQQQKQRTFPSSTPQQPRSESNPLLRQTPTRSMGSFPGKGAAIMRQFNAIYQVSDESEADDDEQENQEQQQKLKQLEEMRKQEEARKLEEQKEKKKAQLEALKEKKRLEKEEKQRKKMEELKKKEELKKQRMKMLQEAKKKKEEEQRKREEELKKKEEEMNKKRLEEEENRKRKLEQEKIETEAKKQKLMEKQNNVGESDEGENELTFEDEKKNEIPPPPPKAGKKEHKVFTDAELNSVSDLMGEVLPVVAKIPKLDGWMKSGGKSVDEVLYKLVGYLLKIGQFVTSLKGSERQKQLCWAYAAKSIPHATTGEDLKQLYLDTKQQVTNER